MSSPLDPGESPGFLLWRVTLAWQRLMTATLKPYGLTHVQFVLLASSSWLGRHHEPPTQRQLADHAGTDPMMTSQVLRSLEQQGLVERRPDPRDGRARRIVVTPTGGRLARRTVAVVEAADSDFFAGTAHEQLMPALRELAGEHHGLAQRPPSRRLEQR